MLFEDHYELNPCSSVSVMVLLHKYETSMKSLQTRLAGTGLSLVVMCSSMSGAEQTETAGGWRKYEGNPVLGGTLGTCFDVALLKEGSNYRMWFSWRPKKGIAMVESTNGTNWSQPDIAIGPNRSTEWEDEVNRPVVVHRSDGYHMWYTGQA